MPTISSAESRTLIENVCWETYLALAENRPGNMPRMCYMKGSLELMSPKKEHETAKSLLGRLIHVFCDIRQIEILSVASTTFRRQDLDRGFEADESYYIEHAEVVRSKVEIDLSIDPPPELVIEIEITSSALAKLDLFATMGIQEVWRHNGCILEIFRLCEYTYEPVETSLALPGFPIKLTESLLKRRFAEGETSLVRQFRDAVE